MHLTKATSTTLSFTRTFNRHNSLRQGAVNAPSNDLHTQQQEHHPPNWIGWGSLVAGLVGLGIGIKALIDHQLKAPDIAKAGETAEKVILSFDEAVEGLIEELLTQYDENVVKEKNKLFFKRRNVDYEAERQDLKTKYREVLQLLRQLQSDTKHLYEENRKLVKESTDFNGFPGESPHDIEYERIETLRSRLEVLISLTDT